MAWRMGVDIGGTFTDVALVDDGTGAIGIAKTLTTPDNFSHGVVSALEEAIDAHDVPPGDVTLLSHATTVVTNAILEEKGARTALISTRGFRDLLELRRSSRANLYDIFQDPPSVLVARHARLEITERIGAAGEVVIPLAEDEIDGLVEVIESLDVDAVAVSLLFSFLNDAHERQLGARLRAALPETPIFLSSEVLPEMREFERTSTTAVCAYVGPILDSYLKELAAAIAGLGLPDLHVMGSAGGVVDVEEALRMPAAVVESGPAAGVIATALIGRQIQRPDLLSFDMGGTTAKASLIKDGEIETTAEYEVGGDGSQSRWLHGTGHPIRVPVIDLAEVSAGGGSIAWVDPAGSLRVGPLSAGADPGPVCYAKGGTQPVPTLAVPYPLEYSGASVRDDSLVRVDWTTRATVPDPLAGGDEGPKLLVEAVLYGEDVIASEIADTCNLDTVEQTDCYSRHWEAYRAKHRPDSLMRIELNLRSTFSVNSLDTKFWNIYLRGQDDIMHEPVDIVQHEPVVVRRDSLPAQPGRAPIRAGLYRRSVDLYFQITTPFGARTMGPDVPSVVLVMSKNRAELTVLTWNVDGQDVATTRRRRRRENESLDF